MIGSVVVWIGLLSAVTSGCLYYVSIKKHSLRFIAQSAFFTAAICTLLASALLMLFIVQHRFEFNYVANYSSRDLPFSLLITTFWAGQEGSFMLWALLTSLIGLVLQRYSSRKNIEAEVMTTYSIVLGFLLLLLSIKSPFEYIWQAQAGIEKGFVPLDGHGLNPLLQNIWMIIHPPILFLGFSSLAVPFVLAVAALWQRNYKNWIYSAIPWILFSALALGTGLMLGGYWAYGVLGWGGWWGWDPVENSSLVPWIVTVILVHTMLIQIVSGKLVRTNFVLAVLAYLLVVYSTFLTRSGILADSSVHSFVDPGTFAYVLLVLWLVVVVVGGFGMLWRRRNELHADQPPMGFFARESVLSFALLVLGACAAIILFGTSMPLFSKSALEPSFYDKTTLPLAVLLTILLGCSLAIQWNREDRRLFLKNLLIPLAIAAVGAAAFIAIGLRDFGAGALIFSSLFSLSMALKHGYRVLREQPKFIGGSLSHIGLAILLLGIIGSGRYGVKKSVALSQNQPQNVMGYMLTYLGDSLSQEGKTVLNIRAEKNGSRSMLRPVMYESSYNNSLMRNPDYLSSFVNDLYIEPVSLEGGKDEDARNNMIELIKGVPWSFGPMTVTFLRFQLEEQNMENMRQGHSPTIGAVLEVKIDSATEELVPLTTFKAPPSKPEMKAAYIKSGHLGFQLVKLNISGASAKTKIIVQLVGPMMASTTGSQPDVLVAEVSVKPFMGFIWISAFFIMSGIIAALVRRMQKTDALS